GFNAAQMYQAGVQQQQQFAQQQQSAPTPAADSWKCACGATASGKFCTECGAKKPEAEGWTCACGAVNKGKFCPNCGQKKPAGAPLYQCDKCGWKPEDPHNPPKFCPECGDTFDSNDIQ
ncbi:MAG: SPFH domain-containing protein, partial [Clostridia bacterium]|nr:SPFH domain-containing protein [Clostridia bacterium]